VNRLPQQLNGYLPAQCFRSNGSESRRDLELTCRVLCYLLGAGKVESLNLQNLQSETRSSLASSTVNITKKGLGDPGTLRKLFRNLLSLVLNFQRLALFPLKFDFGYLSHITAATCRY